MDFAGLHHLNELKEQWQVRSKASTASTTAITTTPTTDFTVTATHDQSATGHNSDPSDPPKTDATVNDKDRVLSQLTNNKQFIALQQCEHKDVVIIAKHLCGSATDLAIRSLLVYRVDDKATGTTDSSSTSSGIASGTNANSSSSSSSSNTTSSSAGPGLSSGSDGVQGVVLDARAKGCAIATCCHHVSLLLLYTLMKNLISYITTEL